MRIIVGYLATPSGEDGLHLGALTARTLGASMDICLVLPEDSSSPTRTAIDASYEKLLEEQAEEWLAEARALVPEDVAVETHVSFDDSFAEGLIAEATRLDAQAIVIGAAGDGLIDRHSIGTVANDLLHSSPVPVVLAPRGFRNSSVRRVREITCAIGTRPGARELLATAVRACQRAEVPLRLISLVSLAHPFAALRKAESGSDEAALEHARAALDKARELMPPDIAITTDIAEGSTIEAAIEKLEWQDGDVIIVGSSRLASPRLLFLGSTAAKMLRVVPAPMIVVPAPEQVEAAQES